MRWKARSAMRNVLFGTAKGAFPHDGRCCSAMLRSVFRAAEEAFPQYDRRRTVVEKPFFCDMTDGVCCDKAFSAAVPSYSAIFICRVFLLSIWHKYTVCSGMCEARKERFQCAGGWRHLWRVTVFHG